MKPNRTFSLIVLLAALASFAAAPFAAPPDNIMLSFAARHVDAYDAEYHIRLVAGDSSDSIATQNTTRLNAAQAAMKPTGEYEFNDNQTGPVIRPIHFAAKTFYFKGPIITPRRNGGALIGSGTPGYLLPQDQYGAGDNLGGAVTRFVRTDEGTAVIRLRGSGYTIANMEILARPFPTGTGTGAFVSDSGTAQAGAAGTLTMRSGAVATDDYYNGHLLTITGGTGIGQSRLIADYTGSTKVATISPNWSTTPDNTSTYRATKPVACIEVEGNNAPATGGNRFTNITFAESTYGIRTLAGYYDDDDEIVSDENHADGTVVDRCTFTNVDAAFRSENQQSIGWVFRDPHYNLLAAGTMIGADIVRGGNVTIDNPLINHNKFTIFKIYSTGWSQNNDNLECRNFRWDTFDTATDYLCLLESNIGGGANATYVMPRVRISGHIPNIETGQTSPGPVYGYDETQLLKLNGLSGLDRGSSVTTETGLTNIWIDIQHWPKAANSNSDWVPTGYTLGTATPWRRVVKTIP